MKKYIKIMPFIAIFLAYSANAEVALKNSSEIVGLWDVHDEATSLTAPKKHTDTVWDVKDDGTIIAESHDKSARVGDTKITIKYSVEDGKLKKQVAPGREKYETCTIIEKDDKNMIVHCAYYLYLTRK